MIERFFQNKIVYLISPQKWGGMKVSKHHYALELAANNCPIFFLEPPSLSNKGIQIKPCPDHPLIRIVTYKPIFRGKRFLPSFIFRSLLKFQVKALIKAIGVKPDVVWSFHGDLFENLSWFGAPLNIFFAADLFLNKKLPAEIYSADFTLAVSDSIYSLIKESKQPVFFINHGLQPAFVKAAEQMLQKGFLTFRREQIVVGYIGNLRMEALDRQTMMEVIAQNTVVKFIFWGSYKADDLNLGGLNDNEVDRFICFLENQPNVELRGVLQSNQLQEQMKEADIFWLCWKIGINSLWDGSNSHKILEYLSTGRPVISHHVSSYKDSDLLYMLQTTDNQGYTQLFNTVIELVKQGEKEAIVTKRIKTAVDNSYASQLEKIEQILISLTANRMDSRKFK